MQNLTLLDLYECEITDEGARAIAESKHLKNLKSLVLIHNDISDEVQELIKNSPNLPNLENLVFRLGQGGETS